MGKTARSLILILISSCMVLYALSAFAGSTCVQIQTETGGCIRALATAAPNCDNLRGAMFWDGTGWHVNDTYAHM